MNRLYPESWQERCPGVAAWENLDPSQVQMPRYLSLSVRARNQGVCGHKRRQVVAEPLKGVYTGVK